MKLFILLASFLFSLSAYSEKVYTFYADTHVFSKYLSMWILPTTTEQIFGENAFFLGDIVEAKNAEKNQCAEMKEYFRRFSEISKNRMVLGNHDGSFQGVDDILVDGHILITHGDRFLWTKKHSERFRNEKQCQGSGLIQKILSKHHGSVSNREASDAAEYARLRGADTIVFGHVHVDRKLDKIVNGIRVICLPRGKTELNL